MWVVVLVVMQAVWLVENLAAKKDKNLEWLWAHSKVELKVHWKEITWVGMMDYSSVNLKVSWSVDMTVV